MSEEKKAGWYHELPPWGKGLVIGGIVVVAVGGFFGGRHWYKTWKDTKGDRQANADSQSALNALQNNGIKPTYAPAQYSTYANILKQAMDGCGDGWANTKSVWSAMKNDADVHALIVAYGNKTVDKCGLWTGDFSGDLGSTLAYKYSGVEASTSIGSINAINTIFQSNGVTFRF